MIWPGAAFFEDKVPLFAIKYDELVVWATGAGGTADTLLGQIIN